MSYYHTARAHVKSLKTLSEDNKRKAERRAEVANVQAEQPVNILRVDGRPCKMFRSEEQYRAIESTEGMIPWNGQTDNLIDRFDGRALLDFYKEPPPASRRRQKTDDEAELDQLVTFEAFRDLVMLLHAGYAEQEGLEVAIKHNIELRATAVATAAAAAGLTRQQGPTGGPGVSHYSAVGFSYGGGDARSSSESDSDDSSASEDNRNEDERRADLAADGLAANVGVDNFSLMLHRAEQQEEDELLGRAPRKKRMFSRKKAAERAKRMAGQGLGPLAKDRATWKPEVSSGRDRDEFRPGYGRRHSPEYNAYRPRSPSPVRQRSRSPRRQMDYHSRGSGGRTEFITEFKIDREHRQSARAANEGYKRAHQTDLHATPTSQRDQTVSSNKRRDSFLDAIPSRADPAVNGGPVLLPVAGTAMQGVRSHDYRDRPEYRERSDRQYSRDGRPEADARTDRVSSGSKASASVAKDAAKLKETPMERLKRLRAAQLNKTFRSEVLTNTQKRAAEERERQARLQIERAARAYSPPPRRSRSPPSRRRSRSRSPDDLRY